MPIAVDTKKSHPYILKRERGLEASQQTTFWLRAQSVTCSKEFATALKVGTEVHAILAVLRHCLDRWENFPLADGTQAPFAKDPAGFATEATLELIHPTDRDELATAVLDLGRMALSETDRKN